MKILETRQLHAGHWTEYLEKVYLDRTGQEKRWSYIGRRNRHRAVVVIPTTREQGDLILIRQFRLPLEHHVLEFPAGLIDAGESVEAAALRELREETGYSGEILSVSALLTTSPGLTNEEIIAVRVRCEEEPSHPLELDDSEMLSVVRIPAAEIPALARHHTGEDTLLDSKVAFFLIGMLQGS